MEKSDLHGGGAHMVRSTIILGDFICYLSQHLSPMQFTFDHRRAKQEKNGGWVSNTTTTTSNSSGDSEWRNKIIRCFHKISRQLQTISMEQIRGSLKVIARVIESLTFQIVINPPRGVFQTN